MRRGAGATYSCFAAAHGAACAGGGGMGATRQPAKRGVAPRGAVVAVACVLYLKHK